MRDLLVAVLTVTPERVTAGLAEVDRPGRLLREVAVERATGADEPRAAASDALHRLAAAGSSDDLSVRLLALAVATDPGVDASSLRSALGSELPEGWGLPATLPVVHGSADGWAAAGAAVAEAPLVAGAVVAAARSVGAHAHLPRG